MFLNVLIVFARFIISFFLFQSWKNTMTIRNFSITFPKFNIVLPKMLAVFTYFLHIDLHFFNSD